MSALIKAQQLEWLLTEANHPTRYETSVLREEAVFTTGVGTHVAKAIPKDERAAVQDTEGRLRHQRVRAPRP